MRWLQTDIDIIKNYYSHSGVNYCYKLLEEKFSKRSIRHKASRLNIAYLKVWTSEKINKLKQLTKDQVNIKKCSKQLCMSYCSTRRVYKKLGLKPKNIWNKKSITFLLKMYPKFGINFCAKRLGMSIKKIKSKVTRLKLKLLPKIKQLIQKENASSYWRERDLVPRKVNQNKFINPISKEAAYILGIIWADGYLNNKSQHFLVSLEAIRSDMEQLHSVFNSTGKWHISYRIRKKRKPQMSFTTRQKPLYNFLKENNYEKKTKLSANKILSKIDKSLHPLWWRGYFDGDGCFYIHKKRKLYQVSLAGNVKQNWDFAIELLTDLNINFTIVKRKQKRKNGKISHSSVVRFGGKDNFKKFRDYIYSDYDDIGLSRKYLKSIGVQ